MKILLKLILLVLAAFVGGLAVGYYFLAGGSGSAPVVHEPDTSSVWHEARHRFAELTSDKRPMLEVSA